MGWLSQKMRRPVLAYVAQPWREAGRLVVGRWAKLVTSPPLDAETFSPALLEGRRLLFFKLHGLAGQPYWHNAGWVTALTAEQIKGTNLKGVVAVVANCFGRGGPMEAALIDAGTAVVFGDVDEAYGRTRSLGNADLLCHLLVKWLKRGVAAHAALIIAKRDYRARVSREGWTRMDDETLRDFGFWGDPNATTGRIRL